MEGVGKLEQKVSNENCTGAESPSEVYSQPSIIMDGVSASWSHDQERMVLRNISFDIVQVKLHVLCMYTIFSTCFLIFASGIVTNGNSRTRGSRKGIDYMHEVYAHIIINLITVYLSQVHTSATSS